MNNFEKIFDLRRDRLNMDEFICSVCGLKGNNKDMGIEPNKDVTNGKIISIDNIHSAHLKCME